MKITQSEHQRLRARLEKLNSIRSPFFSLWGELADYILPRRYVWLQAATTSQVKSMRNPNILDSTGTKAASILASGMMNGITSPARPWFSLRIAGNDDLNDSPGARIWLDEVARRLMLILSESNFYNAMATLYLDLVVFGSACMLVYEDYDDVIRCYNCALGEFYLSQDDRLSVNGMGRKFTYTVEQACERWGEENLRPATKALYRKGGASTQEAVPISHLIEPNKGASKVPPKFRYRETYWESGSTDGNVLAQHGFNEMPGVFPRWEVAGNDAYGSSPGMEALGDIIQLQFETKRKAQGIDKLVNPPLLLDSQLQHRPVSSIPGGVTFISGANNVGAKPLYQVAPQIGELTQDIAQIQMRVRETFHNSLFQMISQLDTVRSAAEIDGRREEKLVLLGPVLERFENEALDPALTRVYSIASRAGLFPPPPAEIAGQKLQVQYVSILSTAQSAVSAAPTERWIGFIGNIAALRPEVGNIPDWEEVVRGYGKNLGVPAKQMKSKEESQQATQQQNQMAATQVAAQTAKDGAAAAQQLSATDVGGGANALQQVLGG